MPPNFLATPRMPILPHILRTIDKKEGASFDAAVGATLAVTDGMGIIRLGMSGQGPKALCHGTAFPGRLTFHGQRGGHRCRVSSGAWQGQGDGVRGIMSTSRSGQVVDDVGSG
jgi:hypothetical protein